MSAHTSGKDAVHVSPASSKGDLESAGESPGAAQTSSSQHYWEDDIFEGMAPGELRQDVPAFGNGS